MAEMVDIEELGTGDELQAVDTQPQPVTEPAVSSADDTLPEKYRGKSVQDIVKMHQEAERFASRQAQEVGEIRQLADQLIQSQMKPKSAEIEPEIDFFANPKEAVRQAVESDPVVVQARAQVQQLQQLESKRTLLQAHPDVGQIMADPEFGEWVLKSKVRTKLFQQAEAYDVEAADELLSTYKELRQVRQSTTQNVSQPQENPVDAAVRSNAIQAASVDASGSGETTRKVYRRADLIRLKMTNPSKYEAMEDDIRRAYAEDRVR